MRHLLVTLALAPAVRDQLRRDLTDAEIRFVENPTDDEARWADVVFGNLAAPMLLRVDKPPTWLHSPNVGLDSYVPVQHERPDIEISNAQGVMNHAVAEHAVALLLALSRNIPEIVRGQAGRTWDREAYMGEGRVRMLAGRQAHVLGFGSIARTLIDKLVGLGLRVTVYRREDAGSHQGVDRFAVFEALVDLLPEADVLVGILPAKPETVGLVGSRELEALKDGAYLVNVGRGSLINQPALIARLQAGHLAGAALDVFDEEPLPQDSPLWTLPNVIVSPHVAGRFDQEMARHAANFALRYRERYP